VRPSEGSNAEVLFTKSPRRTLNGLSVRFEGYDSDVPAVVRNRVGRGAVYYFAADVAAGYSNHGLPRVAQLVASLERRAARPPLELDAPNALEVTAFWRGPKRMDVHLVNCTALSLKQMAPLADVGITVNQGTVRRATLPLSGTVLDVEDNRLTVPVVRYGEVLALEFE
jgi:hypothetical protein